MLSTQLIMLNYPVIDVGFLIDITQLFYSKVNLKD